MPRLDWIGRKAVENHHRQVPFHLLKEVPELSVGDLGSGIASTSLSTGLLVKGDNLLALKALLPYYAGQVKCIYIDPPYNTGEENWIYNDNVNSPEIRKWLGKLVGGELDDLSRHDKWLCMMYPRLMLLREMLREDGAIFISIDDNEIAHLHNLMKEIFSPTNFVANIIWQKRTSPDARLNLGPAHDFIVVYAKNIAKLKPTLNRVPPSEKRAKAYKNPDNDPRGVWASVDLTGQTGHATPEQFYEITTPSGLKMKPPAGRCWALAERTFVELAADNRIWFGNNGQSRPRLKKFLAESEGVTTWTWWDHNEVGHNQEATKELNGLMVNADVFDNPKPTRLIRRILQLATEKDSLILDSFAGSGTTGHAVMQLNKEDGGNRRCILVEMDANICRNVTAERLRRVSQGYKNAKGEDVPGLVGSFRFITLGEPLFDERGNIRKTVKFHDLARHVYFTETGEPLPAIKELKGKAPSPTPSPSRGEGSNISPPWLKAPTVGESGGDKGAGGRSAGMINKENSPLIGICNGIAVYLLYNGILKDKSPDGGNVLTTAVLSHLPKHDGPKVIYGTACRIGPERLRLENITFKQLPYKIKVM